MKQNELISSNSDELIQNNQQITQKLQNLKSKITLNNHQMLQLTYDDEKFTQKILQFNQQGVHLIEYEKYTQAILYFSEAEKLLQYAASCGRSLGRDIILNVLHNSAVIYQKTWHLDKSISYVQAIIFNLKSFICLPNNLELIQSLKQLFDKSQDSSMNRFKFIEDNNEKINTLIMKKYTLATYYLQFSNLSSQNQNHYQALTHIQHSMKIFRQNFQLIFEIIKIKNKTSQKKDKLVQVLLQKVLKYTIQQKDLKYSQSLKLLANVKRSYQQKSVNKQQSFQYLLAKYSSPQTKQTSYKNFSLTQLTQLDVKKSFNQKILDTSQNHQQIFNYNHLIEKILIYSVTFFIQHNQLIQLKDDINQEQTNVQEQYQQNDKIAEIYIIISLTLSIVIVDQLTPFARQIYKKYFQQKQSKKVKDQNQNFSKMLYESAKLDNLKLKYKKYVSQHIQILNPSQSDQSSRKQIQQYNLNFNINRKPKQKSSKLNKLLQKIDKQNYSLIDIVIQSPPRLINDISQVQSVDYANGSATFTKNYFPPQKQQSQEENSDDQNNLKQTTKINSLKLKKITSMPNLSDISNKSNEKDQLNVEKKKSKSKTKIRQLKHKIGQSKTKIKNVSSSKAVAIKRLGSPKHKLKSIQKRIKLKDQKINFLVNKILPEFKIQSTNKKNIHKSPKNIKRQLNSPQAKAFIKKNPLIKSGQQIAKKKQQASSNLKIQKQISLIKRLKSQKSSKKLQSTQKLKYAQNISKFKQKPANQIRSLGSLSLTVKNLKQVNKTPKTSPNKDQNIYRKFKSPKKQESKIYRNNSVKKSFVEPIVIHHLIDIKKLQTLKRVIDEKLKKSKSSVTLIRQSSDRMLQFNQLKSPRKQRIHKQKQK